MCDRWKKRIKLNNHGSTLALAVATIAFVALLAATVISAASVNLALKRAQVYSDRAFYTAETAVDEVYTGLGVKSLNMLNSVFADVSSNLLETDLTTGMQFMVDNKTANLSKKARSPRPRPGSPKLRRTLGTLPGPSRPAPRSSAR